MKKYLSIKAITRFLRKSDREYYKLALAEDSKRLDFIMIVGDILAYEEQVPGKEELPELLENMVAKLFENRNVRKTLLAKLEFAEKEFLGE